MCVQRLLELQSFIHKGCLFKGYWSFNRRLKGILFPGNINTLFVNFKKRRRTIGARRNRFFFPGAIITKIGNFKFYFPKAIRV